MAVKILLIEDEDAAARRLLKMVNELMPEAEIPASLDSIEATVEWLNQNPQPDLMLMDIHLADGSSFKIFEEVEVQCPVIFITAYDQYAVKAFKVNSIDYLLKPVKREELEQALQRFKKLHKTEAPAIDYAKLVRELQGEKKDLQKRFLVKIGQSLKAVEPQNVAYIHSEHKITFLCTFDGHRYPVDHSLDKMEELLNPQQFFRINRQFLINVDAIDQMFSFSKGRVKLVLKPKPSEDTIVSVERSPVFREWLEGKKD